MATPIKSIRPNQQYDTTIARICRSWINKDFTIDRVISSDYILVDEEHETIHATVRHRDIDTIAAKLQAGTVYEIRRFFVDQSKSNYRVVPHIAMLQFTRASTFTAITEEVPAIPLHRFNLVDYDHLPERIQIHSILTDVIGVLTSAHPIQKTFFNNRTTQRKTVNIQNIRSDSLQVTLWRTLAKNFDEEIDKVALEQQ